MPKFHLIIDVNGRRILLNIEEIAYIREADAYLSPHTSPAYDINLTCGHHYIVNAQEAQKLLDCLGLGMYALYG
jgi:hypothetical protein